MWYSRVLTILRPHVICHVKNLTKSDPCFQSNRLFRTPFAPQLLTDFSPFQQQLIVDGSQLPG